jgi:hypothetical protein
MTRPVWIMPLVPFTLTFTPASWMVACLLLGWLVPLPPCPAAEGATTAPPERRPPMIEVTRRNGEAVPLEPEDLSGLQAIPLLNVKHRLEKQFYEGFVSLYKMRVPQGEVVTGTHTLQDGPMRLTVYQISKERKGVRKVRVLASGFHPKGEVATFTSPIDDLEENVFLVTAEKVSSDTELNSHLKYMNAQGNMILLKGYSTNWGMTKLKFELSGRAASKDKNEAEVTDKGKDKGKDKARDKKEDTFVRDADWLIERLLNPQWVMLVRVDSKGAE